MALAISPDAVRLATVEGLADISLVGDGSIQRPTRTESISGRPFPLREAAASRPWQAAAIVAHNLVAVLPGEIAAGNWERLRERVANVVE
jgi:hypothetical protein